MTKTERIAGSKGKSSPAKPELRDTTEAEKRAIAEAKERQSARPARLEFTVKNDDGRVMIENPHRDGHGMQAHLDETFGTTSRDFTDAALQRVLNVVASQPGSVTAAELNSATALMGAIAPANELEAALGEQIIGSHALAMEFMRRARQATTLERAQAYGSLATKASRTTAVLVDSLTKQRTGGKQTVEVRYVYVDQRNQTLIQAGGPGGANGNVGQPHASNLGEGVGALGPALWGENAPGDLLPSPSHPREDPMSASRWSEPRRALRGRQRQLSDGAAHQGSDRRASPAASDGPAD